jgi:hypothetical protein
VEACCLLFVCPGVVAKQIEALLLRAIVAPEEALRLCAAQWAVELYPFSSVTARYLSCLAAGDKRQDVREAGLAGLKFPSENRRGGEQWPLSKQ